MKKSGEKIFPKALICFAVLMLLCGGIYTFVMTGICQGLFGEKANGSIIEADGKKYGSELLAQQFQDRKHMWGRVMYVDTSTYTDDKGNTIVYAGASNKSPAGEELEKIVAERVKLIKESNPDAKEEKIPVELVTASGSGLDPHISPAAAKYQIPRLARENGMTKAKVAEIIKKCTKGRWLGIIGEETVNVLKVNLMLEGILK